MYLFVIEEKGFCFFGFNSMSSLYIDAKKRALEFNYKDRIFNLFFHVFPLICVEIHNLSHEFQLLNRFH